MGFVGGSGYGGILTSDLRVTKAATMKGMLEVLVGGLVVI